MLATNYLVCSVLGVVYGGFELVAPQVEGFSLTVWLGLVSGVMYLTSLVLFQVNTNRNGIVLSSVFMKLGLLVPIVASVLFFHEIPTLSQIVGFCIAIFAIVLINLKKEGDGKAFGFGLIVMLLLSGAADVMAKIFNVFCPEDLSALYLFYTFATAFVLCVALVMHKKERPGFRELLYGTLIGIPNFFSAKFLLGALTKLPAVVVYPSFSVGTMLVVTLTGVAVFRERLSKVQWIALAAIIAALVLLNI
jgi:drug/metabolite transporter (DMT)-like permease